MARSRGPALRAIEGARLLEPGELLKKTPSAASASSGPSPRVLLVLHAHLPWVLETAFEHWLHEAVLECYLPLLRTLEAASRGCLTLSITPVLVAMLEDEQARRRGRLFIERRAAERATNAAQRWHKDQAERALEELRGPTIVQRLKSLEASGRIELAASAITHGLLPLLATVPHAAQLQVALGLEAHRRAFGRSSTGFWLPECGYAPGLDGVLAANAVRYTFLDSDAVAHAVRGTEAPVLLPGGVVALPRDPLASEQVWSAQSGYPGDPAYADFYVRDRGRRVFAVAKHGPDVPWQPEVARARAHAHARHFAAERAAGAPLQVAPYDAELFGHWWLEGPWFLEEVLRSTEGLSVPRSLFQGRTTLESLNPGVSSWGRGGGLEVWLGPHNAWMWPHLHRAAEQWLQLSKRAASASLNALLLAQASDWPFLIDARTAAGFAEEQFQRHLLAFRRGESTATPFPWAGDCAWRAHRQISPRRYARARSRSASKNRRRTRPRPRRAT